MGIGIPKESYVVGYELENGLLVLYAGMEDPEKIASPEVAWKLANEFHEKGLYVPGAKTKFQVYKMIFEEVEPIKS